MKKKYPISNILYLILLFILIYIIYFTILCLIKYKYFLYQGLDLAIFNQVFFNTWQGNILFSSIQNQNYFGEHFAPFIFLLLPFYLIYKDPKTLLFLQTIFLALPAIPIYLIAKDKLKNKNFALIFSLIYLLYPILHSINLFEFHILALSIFFLLFAFYFFQKKKFLYFIIFILLSLSIREDVAFIIFMFGFYAIIKRKSLKWIFAPIALSLTWLLISFKIIKYLNPEKTYKYLTHYSWLGQNFFEIITNLFLKLPDIIFHLLKIENFIFIIYLFLPLLFLPFFSKGILIFLIPPTLQYGLANNGLKNIFFTHYASLFIPFIFIAAIYGFTQIKQSNFIQKIKIKRIEKFFGLIILFITLILCNIAFSPLISLSKKLLSFPQPQQKELIKQIPKNAKILTTRDFIANLSSRQYLYSTIYVIKGQEQYSKKKYKINQNLDMALINYEKFYQYCSYQKKLTNKTCQQAIKRLNKIINKNNLIPGKISNNTILYSKNKQLKSLQEQEQKIKLKLKKQQFILELDESSLEKIIIE